MNNGCRRCGKEAEEGELYCASCRDSAGTTKPRNVWLFTTIFLLLLLVLAGMFLWNGNCCKLDLSWDRLTGKPAALINDEAVSRADLQTRLNIARRSIERQYGNDVFIGNMGKARLLSLRRQVLDRMLEERLIAQKARSFGVQISDESVGREVNRIGGDIYGSSDNFKKMLGEDGITQDAIKNHVRAILTSQALADVLSSRADGRGAQPTERFESWLVQAKQTARVVVYDSSAAAPDTAMVADTTPRSGGCCGTGKISGCGGSSGCGGEKK